MRIGVCKMHCRKRTARARTYCPSAFRTVVCVHAFRGMRYQGRRQQHSAPRAHTYVHADTPDS